MVGPAPANPAASPEPRLDNPGWRARFGHKQAEITRTAPRLLLFGDSIIGALDRHDGRDVLDYAPIWRHFYAGRDAVNLGFAGDATSHLLWRVQNWDYAAVRPGAAVLQIGANNFSRVRRWDAECTFEAIGAILRALARALPQTQVLVLGVFPSVRDAWIDLNTAALNARLAGGLRPFHPAAGFLDLSGVFMAGGKVDPACFVEVRAAPGASLLHPSAQAMARVALAIEPCVSGLLGDACRPGLASCSAPS